MSRTVKDLEKVADEFLSTLERETIPDLHFKDLEPQILNSIKGVKKKKSLFMTMVDQKKFDQKKKPLHSSQINHPRLVKALEAIREQLQSSHERPEPSPPSADAEFKTERTPIVPAKIKPQNRLRRTAGNYTPILKSD